MKKKVPRTFKSGGLHEKHVVGTWKLGNRLSIRLQTQGNREKSKLNNSTVLTSLTSMI